MLRILSNIAISFVFTANLVCQNEIKLPSGNIERVALDEFENLYISNPTGQIYKFDKTGKLLLSYSPSQPQQVSFLEAFNTIRIFSFYKDLQEFNYFDRFLTFENSINFDQAIIGFARAACTSSDNSIWVFDDTDLNLKKYDPIAIKVLQSSNCTPLLDDSSHQINSIKEYQNKVYLMDQGKGLLIFDNMGNYINKLSIDGLQSFSFFKNTLFALSKSKIIALDLYDKLEVTETINETKCNQYFKTKTAEYFVLSDKIIVKTNK